MKFHDNWKAMLLTMEPQMAVRFLGYIFAYQDNDIEPNLNSTKSNNAEQIIWVGIKSQIDKDRAESHENIDDLIAEVEASISESEALRAESEALRAESEARISETDRLITESKALIANFEKNQPGKPYNIEKTRKDTNDGIVE